MSVLKMSFFGPGQVLVSSDGTAPKTDTKIRSRKEFALLAYLAMESERAHTRDSILGLLWPELSQTQARNNLRVSLARLRKSIGKPQIPFIVSDRHTLRFSAERFATDGNAWLDVFEFDRLLALVDSHDHANPTACPTCLSDMVKAAELYSGEFLRGFHLADCDAFEHWMLIQRERYHIQVLELLPRLTSAHMAKEDWKAAEKIVRQQLALDPLDEEAHRSLMQILALSGLRNAALSHYDIVARLLDEELGVPPDEETVTLVEQIRAGDIAKLTRWQDEKVDEEPDLDVTSSSGHSAIPSIDPIAVLARLDPLPDQRLFGVDTAMETVMGAINATDRSWLVSIEGIGGQGKTTLAYAAVKNLIGEEVADTPFVDVAWVSAKQEEYLPDRGTQATGKPALDEESLMDQLLAQLADGPYPTGSIQEKRLALTQLLQVKRCLVVVDNLETSIDYEALLPLMRHLANPSKFLITSRMSLAGQGDIFCYSLSELSEEDALAFLRYEAESRGMATLAAAADEQLRAIYKTVGGNPLALKLVLGQLQFLPLEETLASLRQADTDHTDQLYTYIYWQAWEMLDEGGRHLLLSLPVLPSATFAQLRNISGLSTSALQAAIMNLRGLSLVELGGDLSEPRYRLHRLTETFLMHEVVKWQETAGLQSTQEATFFIERVLQMVEQWREAEAVQEVDVAILDHEYQSVLKAISLGLELPQGWSTVKPLIIAFTPFMERRGHWHEWHSILERAIDTARCAKDADGEITLTALLARLCQRESLPKDVVYYYRRVIRMARLSGNKFEEARACSNLGYAYIDGGRWWRAEILSSHALEIFKELGNEHGLAHTYNHLGILYRSLGQKELAEQNLTQACQLWQANQDNHSLFNGYMNLGNLYTRMAKPALALEHFTKARKIAEQTGESTAMANLWNNMAILYRQTSDCQKAEKYAKRAEKLFRQQANLIGLAAVWNNLGLIAHETDEHVKALNYLQESLTLYQNLNIQTQSNEVQEDIKKVSASL